MIQGFSKLSKAEKMETLSKGRKSDAPISLAAFNIADEVEQRKLESFSENVIGNYHLPYGICPNVKVNGVDYAVPMVTEESSVVAAAAAAAKFWHSRGGFRTRVLNTNKPGNVYFTFSGDDVLILNNKSLIRYLKESILAVSTNMNARGGGLLTIEISKLDEENYKLSAVFETVDSMGANFINTCLEQMAEALRIYAKTHYENEHLEVLMAILSNNTPECLVECLVECHVSEFDRLAPGGGGHFAHKFKQAVDIACMDVDRAVTHNKGIYNGISAVLLATANDFRAAEAGGHAFAASSGQYASLSRAEIENDIFRLTLTVPLAIGTVGGLTKLHPMANYSFNLLNNPNAKQLMQIIASVGLASNFAAVRSLTTTGIQKGHMKLHLDNILLEYNATQEESQAVKAAFLNKNVSVSGVREFLEKRRVNAD